jgi:hypothetical protein
MPTELTWDGKYNADGSKKSPLRVELPFQTVETVNESAQERQRHQLRAGDRLAQPADLVPHQGQRDHGRSAIYHRCGSVI